MKRGYNFAFTLAEMMVVMLILSIILAAFAPVMTTRNKVNSGSPWSYSTKNNSDAYYGTGGNQMAMIGQPARVDDEPIARLLLNTDSNPLNSNQSHILFKRGTSLLGRLYMNDTNLVISDNYNSISGDNNTMLGRGALSKFTSGNNNTAVGANALTVASSTSNNTAVGANALHTATGAQNVAVGSNALSSATLAEDNVAIGHNALASTKTGSNNIAFGTDAMSKNLTGYRNIGMGPGALKELSGGYYNIALGDNVLSGLTTGEQNIGMGKNALSGLTGSAMSNIAIGSDAMKESITASYNVAIGNSAGQYLKNGSDNIALGRAALVAGGSFNGSNNIGIGQYSLYNVSSTSSNNIAIGAYSLYGLLGGNTNTALGYNACQYVTGNNKTCIGVNSGPSTSDTVRSDSSEVVFIGTANSTVYIPGNLIVGKKTMLGANKTTYGVWLKGTNKSEWGYVVADDYKGGDDNLRKGNPVNIGGFNFSGGTVTLSDIRLKNVKGENKSSLDKIKQLKVFNYTFKKDEKKTPHVGVIAQDLQKIFPDAVSKNEDGYLQIRMEDMFYAVVNAIKELDAKVTSLFNKDSAQDVKIKALEKQNELLIKQNKALEQRLTKLEKK